MSDAIAAMDWGVGWPVLSLTTSFWIWYFNRPSFALRQSKKWDKITYQLMKQNKTEQANRAAEIAQEWRGR